MTTLFDVVGIEAEASAGPRAGWPLGSSRASGPTAAPSAGSTAVGAAAGPGARAAGGAPAKNEYAARSTGGAGGNAKDELVAVLDRMARLCQSVSVSELGLPDAIELLTAMKRATRFLDGAKLSAIGHIEELQAIQQGQFDQLPEGNGRPLPLPGEEKNLRDVLTSSGQQSQAQTGREMSQARAAVAFPLFGAAMKKGLSRSYLEALTSLIGRDLTEQAKVDEATFVEAAWNEPVERFRKTVLAWRVTHRPEQAEKEAAREIESEKFYVSPDRGGYRLSGWLTASDGTLLKHTLNEIVGVPKKDDRRTPPQRNAEALVQLASAALSGSGGTAGHAGPRHEILVHVPLGTLVQTEKAIAKGCAELPEASRAGSRHGRDPAGPADSGETGAGCPTSGAGLGRRGACLDEREQLEADLGGVLVRIRAGIDVTLLEGCGPATLPDGSALPPSELAQMLCDSAVTQVVMGAYGEPLDVSRKQRLFSARQAKAVIARDRHCRYPGCERGAEYAEIHHAQEYERAGPTIIDNAVLFCRAHHGAIHRAQITITHHLGGFAFTKPDGTLIGVTKHRSADR